MFGHRLSILFLSVAVTMWLIPTWRAPAQECITPRLNQRAANDTPEETFDFARAAAAAKQVNAQGDLCPTSESDYTFAQVAPAARVPEEAAEVERVVVRGFEVDPVEYPALPEVEATRINSGKKTSFVKPEEFPAITNNNYREALATTPGLLVSEEPSSPIINIGYRGLDSQRSELTQVLKDGISIKNEQFGFPESHYAPILDAVERIEFIRAGASLQFGPQPGGAINFVTKMPARDRLFHFLTKNAFGSDELFTSFTSVRGTVGPFGYYAYYDHRERDGFRTNSDYQVNNGSAKLVYDASNDSRFILTLDAYEEEHGEPGGLTEVSTPGASLYQENRNKTTRDFDRFRLERYYATLEYEKVFSQATELQIKGFGGYLSRWSKRQRGGGFGVKPEENPDPEVTPEVVNSNDIQLREDWTEGAELRFRHDYSLAGDTSTLTGGLYFYHAEQDRSDERGATPDAEDGVLRRFNTGGTWDGALFAENRFHFGRLSIVPGMRLEFLQQSLGEIVNVTRTNPGDDLLERSDFSFVPLFGLGVSYVLLEDEQATGLTADGKDLKPVASTTPGSPPRLEVYATASQAYRPRTYGELVSTSPLAVINADLEEGHSLQFELGLRGKPLPYLTFDVSGFYFTFEDQISDVTLIIDEREVPSTANAGDARYVGFEGAAELDILALFTGGGSEAPYGRLNLYANATLLDAQFISGMFDGKTPTYAPNYQFKVGGIYRWKEMVKVALLGTLVDDSFANANNTPERFIPNHNVWDLTAEVNFWEGRIGLFGGINNLFNEDFYAEIRDEGIVPAYRRNYYAGLKLRF
ncbi:MAG: TonB-dependent receptor family protein [Chthoniobacterales bacterium]